MNTTEQASAIAGAESAVRNRPNDCAAFEDLGSAYLEADRLDEAMRTFQRAIALNPGTAPAYHKIGWIHYRIGTPQQAMAAFEQAIANDPHFLPAYQGLGWLYVTKLLDYDLVIQAYQRGLAANPGDPSLIDYLGSTYARIGQMEKALGILEQSVKEHPDQIYVYGTLSFLYLRLNRLEDAAAACRREIELKEDAHSPHRVLGLIYHLLGRDGEAMAELERAIQLEPRDYEARAGLAKLYRANGNLPDAEYQYNTGKEMSMEDDEGGLACFYAVYGDVEQALDLLEKACAKHQLSPGWIRIDPELYFIQDEPRFTALIG